MKRNKRSRLKPLWVFLLLGVMATPPLLPAEQQGNMVRKITIAYVADISTWAAIGTREVDCLLSPGGTLSSSAEGVKTAGRFPAESLGALGYQAVNISVYDCVIGLSAVKALAQVGPFVSANLKDKTGARLAKSHIIVNVSGWRIGVTGVAYAPVGDETWAERFKSEMTLDDPAKALEDVVLILEKGSDLRVLLVYGDPVDAVGLMKRYPGFNLCIVAGGAGADVRPVKAGGGYLVRSPPGGAVFALNTVTFADGGEVIVESGCMQVAPVDVSAELQKVYTKHGLIARPAEKALLEVADMRPPTDRLPQKLVQDEIVSLNRSVANRAAKLSVSAYRQTQTYGPLKAAPGRAFFVLTTLWENIIPLAFVYERQVPVAYQIPKLGDHLYLVVNGRRLSRILHNADRLAGHVPVISFSLPRIGAKSRGNVVFEVPAQDLETLDLRLYDYSHGHIFMPLLAGHAEKEEPVIAPQRNEILEAGIYRFKKSKNIASRKAPDGMTFITVDLRARSHFTFEADATAFDPKAKPGDKIQIGTVADWLETRRYLTMVVDGEYGYLPEPETALPDSPRFLPDVPTGEQAVFLVPEKFSSLELRCDFPNAKKPDGQIIHPEPILFALEGKQPELPSRKALLEIEDDIFKVAVTGQSIVEEFAGGKPRDDHALLLLDVTVENRGEKGELFQTIEQPEQAIPRLEYVAESGLKTQVHPLAFQGLHRSAELVWIPAREQRTFQLVFEIPKSDRKLRLAYNSHKRDAAGVWNLPAPPTYVQPSKPTPPTTVVAEAPDLKPEGAQEVPPPAEEPKEEKPVAQPSPPVPQEPSPGLETIPPGEKSYKIPFESNFSDLATRWEIRDDLQAKNKPSQWRLGLAELSGINNKTRKVATALIAGESSWRNYTIETTLFSIRDRGHISVFLFGYQDSEHFYHIGYNLDEDRVELEARTPKGFETLASRKMDLPWRRDIPLRLDFAGGRICFSAENRVIFDINDERYQGGQIGVAVAGKEGGEFLIGPITVKSFEHGKILFKEDFSTGNLNRWTRWDDPKAEEGPSNWALVLSEYSGIENTMEKPATALIAGNKEWKNYSVQTDLLAYSGDGSLTGLIFGYQDPEHFYHVGYNHALDRYELEARTPGGFQMIAFAEMDFPGRKWVPLRVDFANGRILFRADNRIIFDMEDPRFSSGKVGIDTSALDEGDVLLRNFKVTSIDPGALPPKQMQDLLAAKRGAAVIYRAAPPAGYGFACLLDHSLAKKDLLGWAYELDLSKVKLPEEAVFCFPQGRFVEIHRIGFKLHDQHFPKEIKFCVSDQTPKSGFEPLATITLKPKAKSYQEFPVPPIRAKYLKMQITQAYDPKYLKIVEIFVKGYFKEPGTEPAGEETLGGVQLQEKESNNSIAEAQKLPLDTYLGGEAAQQDTDYYFIPLKDLPGETLTLYLNNIGILRPEYTLFTKEKKKVEPTKVDSVGRETTLTYTLKPDDYYLKIVRPETYLNVVYDDSGSMGESVPIVKRVLKGYLDNLGEGLNLKLMKYAGEPIELSDFTRDPVKLKAAIEKEVGGGGGTETFLGLMAAIESVKAKEGNRAVLAMLDVIDGNRDLGNYIKLWDYVLDTQISFTTIGVQSGWDTKEEEFFGNTRGQIFRELAYASRGQFYHSPSDDLVKQSADTLFKQLAEPVQYSLKAKWEKRVREPGFLKVVFEKGAEKETTRNVELILDASGSMWGKIEGRWKISIARAVLAQVIHGLPEKMNVGLRVYGHRYQVEDRRACTDTELIVPIGPLAREKLINPINKIKPKGQTPLVYSVLQAPNDFKDIGRGTVILISDGIESCHRDIRSIGPILKQSGLDLRVHIVGFGIKGAKARKELAAIAKSTGGRYFDAKDFQGLLSSLKEALRIEYAVLDERGEAKASGFIGGKPVKVLEGSYTLRLRLEPEPLDTAVTIKPKEEVRLVLRKEKEKWTIKR